MRVFGIDLVFRQFPVHGIMLLLCPGIACGTPLYLPLERGEKSGCVPLRFAKGAGSACFVFFWVPACAGMTWFWRE